MGPLLLARALSEEKSGNRRRGRRRRRRRSGGGQNVPTEKSQAAESEAVERALSRFSAKPPPMGLPQEIDPPPRSAEVSWTTNALATDGQAKAGNLPCLPG